MSIKRGVFYSALVQVPALVLVLVSSILINRIVGAEGKGVVSVFQANIGICTLILGFNINFALTYIISSKKVSLEKALGIAGLSFAGSAALVILISGIFGVFDFHSSIFPDSYNSIFYLGLLSAAVLLNILNTLFAGIFQGITDFRAVNQVTLLNSIFNCVGFVACFFVIDQLGKANVENVLILTVIFTGFNTLAWLWHYFRKIKVKPVFAGTIPVMKGLFAFSLLSYLSNLINFLNYRMDIWIVDYYRTTEEVGQYSVASNLGQYMLALTAPIAVVLQPYLNDPAEQQKHEKLMFYCKLGGTFALAMIVGGILTSDFLIPLVFGEDFTPAALPFKLLTAGILFATYSQIMAVTVINSGKAIYNLLATIAGLIITLILDITLIPLLGIAGAGIATTAAYFVIFLCVMYFCFSRLRIPFANYFIFTPADVKKLMKRNG